MQCAYGGWGERGKVSEGGIKLGNLSLFLSRPLCVGLKPEEPRLEISNPCPFELFYQLGEISKSAGLDAAKLWHINIQIASLDGRVNAHGVVGKWRGSLKSLPQLGPRALGRECVFTDALSFPPSSLMLTYFAIHLESKGPS